MRIRNFSNTFHRLRKPQNILSHQVLAGGFWLLFLRGGYEVFYLLRIVFLARILSPNDFGLLGIALLIMNLLETFSTTGFQEALVQKKDDVRGIMDTAWTFMIIRGLVLFSILYALAPTAASFFNEPKANLVIKIVAISSALQGFTNIGVIYFRKNLDFFKQFIFQISGILADFIVAVTLAFAFKNIWALVFGLLAGNIVRLIMSFALSPIRPALRFKRGEVRELSRFGRWVLGSTVIMFFIYQGDGFFVGKLLGPAMLGFYQMAYRISNTPATELTHVISQIAFPAYVKLQDDMVKLKEAYLKILRLIAILAFPLAVLIISYSTVFTQNVLGEKWLPMVPALRILAISGLIRSIAATGGSIFYGLGKPELDTRINGVRLILLLSLIYPLTMKHNIAGTALAVLVSTTVATFIFLFWSKRLTRCHRAEYFQIFICPVMGSIIMGIAILSSLKLFRPGLMGTVISAIIGIIAYSGIVLIWEKRFNYGLNYFFKKGNLLLFR